MPRFLTPQQLADELQVSKDTVRRWTLLGLLPKPVRFSHQAVRYRWDQIEQMLETRQRREEKRLRRSG